MKKALLIAAFAVSFSIDSNAQDPAAEVVKITYSETTINKMLENYQTYFKQIAVATYKNESDTNYIKLVTFGLTRMKGILASMVENDLAPLYRKIYTQTELEDLLKFYNSSTGKSFLAKSPELSKGVQNLMVEKYLPSVQKDLENYIKTNQKK